MPSIPSLQARQTTISAASEVSLETCKSYDKCSNCAKLKNANHDGRPDLNTSSAISLESQHFDNLESLKDELLKPVPADIAARSQSRALRVFRMSKTFECLPVPNKSHETIPSARSLMQQGVPSEATLGTCKSFDVCRDCANLNRTNVGQGSLASPTTTTASSRSHGLHSEATLGTCKSFDVCSNYAKLNRTDVGSLAC